MATEHPARRVADDDLTMIVGSAEPGRRQRYESFVWRLRLDEDATITDTSIQHVGTGEIKHWPAWDTADMLSFITSRTAKTTTAAITTATGPRPDAIAARADQPPDAAEPAPTAALRFDTPAVYAGQRPGITLTLDFGPHDGSPYRFVYDLVIVARRLDGDLHRTIARENDVLETGRSSITVRADGLPAGVYRLDAAVTLRKPSRGIRGRTALVEGALLTVLPG